MNVDTITITNNTNTNTNIKATGALDGTTIATLYPTAVKAVGSYHSGCDIIRYTIPLNAVLRFTPAGGSGAITGGSYNRLDFDE